MDSKTTEMGTPRLTVIEEGTALKGSIDSTCAVLVRGKVSGELTCPALSVAPSGGVEGRVKVGTLESQGSVAGDLEADIVRLAGRVADDTVIRARTLEIRLASDDAMVVRFGEAKLEVGAPPEKPQKR